METTSVRRNRWKQIVFAFALAFPYVCLGFALCAGLRMLGLTAPNIVAFFSGIWMMEAARVPITRIFREEVERTNWFYLTGLGIATIIFLVIVNTWPSVS